MKPCERCGRVCQASYSGRRRRCVVCRRLICRECMTLPRMKDEVIWCETRPNGCPAWATPCLPPPVVPRWRSAGRYRAVRDHGRGTGRGLLWESVVVFARHDGKRAIWGCFKQD